MVFRGRQVYNVFLIVVMVTTFRPLYKQAFEGFPKKNSYLNGTDVMKVAIKMYVNQCIIFKQLFALVAVETIFYLTKGFCASNKNDERTSSAAPLKLKGKDILLVIKGSVTIIFMATKKSFLKRFC